MRASESPGQKPLQRNVTKSHPNRDKSRNAPRAALALARTRPTLAQLEAAASLTARGDERSARALWSTHYTRADPDARTMGSEK